ncbi:threonine aldolase family protein [Psychroflexus aestuariivivens]|uniref:threonine aldolase family protein n=1 Tax=Psychroflexus aestuariivivens TaxID=1795040 RepID=UPI000FD6DCFB|nr:GntG family PLP-dependent aldolase [Psychroflexus aestuariivivens]
MKIDLRSDTVTKPTAEMLEYMMNAEVGDDVYKEDPSVNQLEDYLANLFGMDAALYFPTGTMANQAAIKLHTQPGEQLICDKWAHVFNYEGGGVAFNSGVSCKLVDGHRGKITADLVKEAINPPDFYHSPLSSLVCLENTTNKGGGACYDLDNIREIKKVCQQNGLGLHLDGARLFNALVAKNQDPKDFGNLFDTISVCLSKGLGAPMGTVLIGKDKLMKNAIRVRKVLGGGMRQIGVMASGAYYALHNHVERLEIDNNRALEIGQALGKHSAISEVEEIETNIVIFYLHKEFDEIEFMRNLESKGIRISNMGNGKMRLVTHLDYKDAQHNYFLDTLKNL